MSQSRPQRVLLKLTLCLGKQHKLKIFSSKFHDSLSSRNNFSNDDTIIRPLESQQIKRLYPQHFDRKKELKKLNHSLLVNFLDLIDILIQAPESPRRTEKIDDLTLLFVHIHHLLNEVCVMVLINLINHFRFLITSTGLIKREKPCVLSSSYKKDSESKQQKGESVLTVS